MKPYEIYIAYISWGDGGKRRPVLVLREANAQVSILRITTQYENKSAAVQSKYLAINDWKQAGLHMPSYVDTSKIVNLPAAILSNSPIGRLSDGDKQRLSDRAVM